MKKRRALNIQRMIEQYVAGRSLQEVGSEQGVSKHGARYRLVQAGIVMRPRGRPRSAAT